MSREPRDDAPRGHAARAQRAAAARARGLQRPPQARSRSCESAARGASEGGRIDWAHAEALAFATLLALGVPVRLTGQDTERGTFSQRHLVLHDAETGERFTPLQHLPGAAAPFELHNSPLSEQGCVGFEYGYSVQAPTRWCCGRRSSATS